MIYLYKLYYQGKPVLPLPTKLLGSLFLNVTVSAISIIAWLIWWHCVIAQYVMSACAWAPPASGLLFFLSLSLFILSHSLDSGQHGKLANFFACILNSRPIISFLESALCCMQLVVEVLSQKHDGFNYFTTTCCQSTRERQPPGRHWSSRVTFRCVGRAWFFYINALYWCGTELIPKINGKC